MARQARRYQLAATTIVLFASLLVLVPTASKARVVARVGQSPRPNIVLIVTDDQRADIVRFMQNVRRLLARRGIRFENGYVTNPLCCPSRASILTGNYSHTTRVYSNGPGGPFESAARVR